MILELFVAGLCITGSRCDQAAKAYYASTPTARIFVKEKKSAIKKSIGNYAYHTAPVALALVTHKVPQVRISRYFSCGTNGDKSLCLYTYSF